MLRLRRWARKYDRAILHYQPSHFHFKGASLSRFMTNLGMFLTFAFTRNLEIICHEVEYPRLQSHRKLPHVLVERAAWRFAKQVTFHSQIELDEMKNRFGVTPKKFSIRDHGTDFRAYTSDSQASARAKLGLPIDVRIALCIGFIKPHKGFHRAVSAFSRIPASAGQLIVAGKTGAGPADSGYLEYLKDKASGLPHVQIWERSLSDESFDRIIIASDVVVLPYLHIWSSSVVARAKLLDRPMIAARVGAIPEQARGPRDSIFEDDEGLVSALAKFFQVTALDEPIEGGHLDYDAALSTMDQRATEKRQRASGAATVRSADLVRKRLIQRHERLGHVIPSSRPLIGPLVTLVRKVIVRVGGWAIDPVVEEMRLSDLEILGRLEELERRQ